MMASVDALPFALTVAIAINAATAFAFAADKRAAIENTRRTRESTLLWLAFMGGSPAAFWARRRFRHKTRKQPFCFNLHLIATVQAGVVLGLLTLLF